MEARASIAPMSDREHRTLRNDIEPRYGASRELAEALGMPYSTLRMQVDENLTRALTVRVLDGYVAVTGDVTPLERLADRLGYLLVRRPADAHAITGESLYLLAVHAGHALGLVDAAVERALDPHGDEAERISAAELADIETACAQTERTVEHIRAGARRLHQAQQTLPLREGVA